MVCEAELVVTLECLEDECKEAGELQRCIQIIQLTRKRILRKIARSLWS